MTSDPSPLPLPRAHSRRLREIWRSAGWPCLDLIEVDLLAVGLLERVRHASGHETLRVTDAGVRLLALTHQHNRDALSAHEAVVERVAREMGRAGRIVWRGLALRAPLAGPNGQTAWTVAMPDVYSIRHTSVEDYVEPIVHEVKVSRADLLCDLRREAKRAAYLALSSECWYVIREGIARADEIPAECGVLVATASGDSRSSARRASARCGCRSRRGWRSRAQRPPTVAARRCAGLARPDDREAQRDRAARVASAMSSA